MAYLAAFHWGWLLAALLLGLAMGWIAVVGGAGSGTGRGGACPCDTRPTRLLA